MPLDRQRVWTVIDWAPGQRVMRREDVYDQGSPYMHGMVLQKDYMRVPPNATFPDGWEPVWTVQWDHGKVGKGYLAHGLEREIVDA